MIGHEGRHRIQGLSNSGYDLVEVAVWLVPDPCRFNGDLEQMLAWQWDGAFPAWGQLRTEEAWMCSVAESLGIDFWEVCNRKTSRTKAALAQVVSNLMGF